MCGLVNPAVRALATRGGPAAMFPGDASWHFCDLCDQRGHICDHVECRACNGERYVAAHASPLRKKALLR